MKKRKIIFVIVTLCFIYLIIVNSSYYKLKTLYNNPIKVNQIYKKYTYDEYNDHITILTYQGSEELVKIPEYINDKPVLAIDDSAFYANSKIKKVIIPRNVIRIGHQSFIGCANLKEVVLPNKIIDLGKWSFKGCPNLKKIYVKRNSKTNKTLKKSAFKKHIVYK